MFLITKIYLDFLIFYSSNKEISSYLDFFMLSMIKAGNTHYFLKEYLYSIYYLFIQYTIYLFNMI